jgi:diguanylate cyclase (GGDEF)-like protein
MWNFIALILLTVFLCLALKRKLDKDFIKAGNIYQKIKNEYERLSKENIPLKDENSLLVKAAEETIALYDITKDICKTLDEEKVFSVFKERISKYIEIKDCQFIKDKQDIMQDNSYLALPLEINNKPIGYLAASGIKEEDKEKFHILAQQFLLGIKRALLYKQVQELAITDTLTGIFTRRFYMQRFREELERSLEFNLKFSFLMIDVDHFKDCNDEYGHLVGDVLLKEVSKTIKENIRQIDLMGRYGGEEFSIVLVETDKEGAKFAAERIRRSLEERHIRAYDEDLKATISIGISTFPSDAKNADELIEKADLALYKAKQTGRNKVCVYGT